MRKHRRSVVAAAATLTLLAAPRDAEAFAAPLPPVTQFTKIFVVGDSLSDTHRMGNGLIPYCPNSRRGYWDKRFSNGYLWIDYLVQDNSGLTSKLHNYAVGGASVRQRGGGGLIGKVGKQVEDLLREHSAADVANSLVFVWAGSNDLKESSKSGDARLFAQSIYEELVTGTINPLVNHRVDNFVLIGVPPLDDVPLGRTWSMAQRGWIETAVSHLNARLRARAVQEGWVFVDVASKIIDVMDGRITSVNMTDILNPCHNGPNCVEQWPLDTPGHYRERRCEAKMFFDKVHPTSGAHCGLAKWIEDAMSDQYTIYGGDLDLETCAHREQAGSASWGQLPRNHSDARPIQYRVQTSPNPSDLTCQTTCFQNGGGTRVLGKGNVILTNGSRVGFCTCAMSQDIAHAPPSQEPNQRPYCGDFEGGVNWPAAGETLLVPRGFTTSRYQPAPGVPDALFAGSYQWGGARCGGVCTNTNGSNPMCRFTHARP